MPSTPPTVRALQAQENGTPFGALVHCLAGQSRSVAAVAAYLMRERKHSLRSLIEWDGADHTNGDGLMQRARATPLSSGELSCFTRS